MSEKDILESLHTARVIKFSRTNTQVVKIMSVQRAKKRENIIWSHPQASNHSHCVRWIKSQ